MFKNHLFRKSVLGCLVLAGSILLTGCGNSGDSEEAVDGAVEDGDKGALYFLPIVDVGAYWSVMIAGAESMAEELGYDLIVRTPPWNSTQSNELQIGFVREAIAENAAAMAIAPIDPDMLDRVVADAANSGIPVVTFDADVTTTENRLSYVGTDNVSAGAELGRRAAEHLLENGITEGSIALVATNLTQTTMINRQDGILRGFEEAMGENVANFTWLESIADDDQASNSMQQLAARIVANPDLVAVFSLGSEGPTTGTMEAIRSQGRGGEIFHFGFDYTDTWLNGVEEGLVRAIVNQNAFEIGRQVVRTMVDVIEGREIQDNYPIPVTWVLAEEIEAHGEEIQARMGE